MVIIYAIGAIGLLIGILLGLYARHAFFVVMMAIITALAIIVPMGIMAEEGMAGLAFLILLPTMAPPLLGYWLAYLFGSFRRKPVPTPRKEPVQQNYTNIKSRHSADEK